MWVLKGEILGFRFSIWEAIVHSARRIQYYRQTKRSSSDSQKNKGHPMASSQLRVLGSGNVMCFPFLVWHYRSWEECLHWVLRKWSPESTALYEIVLPSAADPQGRILPRKPPLICGSRVGSSHRDGTQDNTNSTLILCVYSNLSIGLSLITPIPSNRKQQSNAYTIIMMNAENKVR